MDPVILLFPLLVTAALVALAIKSKVSPKNILLFSSGLITLGFLLPWANGPYGNSLSGFQLPNVIEGTLMIYLLPIISIVIAFLAFQENSKVNFVVLTILKIAVVVVIVVIFLAIMNDRNQFWHSLTYDKIGVGVIFITVGIFGYMTEIFVPSKNIVQANTEAAKTEK